MNTKKLFLIRGIPGSGKTDFAESIAVDKNNIVSADQYFEDPDGNYNFDGSKLSLAHKYCKDKTKYKMKNDIPNIYVTNTFTEDWELEQYYILAKEYDYRVYSIIVEKRHDNLNVHGVSDKTIDKMKNRFSINL